MNTLTKSEAVIIQKLLLSKKEDIHFEEYQLLKKINKEFNLVDEFEFIF
jgi:hypothetical protein